MNADQPKQHSFHIAGEDARQPSVEIAGSGENIPVFCAGGCGEVMGYVEKGASIPTRLCAACASARASEPATMEPVTAQTDELAELRSPPKDLRKVHLLQLLAVALIFAGSVYIALGRPLGIYLAAFGTLVWIAVGFILWRLKN